MQEWSYNYSGTCITPQDVYLAHHGVPGMKWGVRRYRNKNGSVTDLGKKRYGNNSPHKIKMGKDTITFSGKNVTLNPKLDKAIKSNKAKVTETYGQYAYNKDTNKLHKKAEKKYAKQMKKASKHVYRHTNRIDAYNEAADIANGGGIYRFNKQQEKKYGKDFANREEYANDYNKYFDSLYVDRYNRALAKNYNNDKHYKKAQKIAKDYDMYSWHKKARQDKKDYEKYSK